MSTRRVKIVILCEDSQQEAFIRRFLKGMGWQMREVRVEKSPGGSAEQWVRERFPLELRVYKQRRNLASSALIAMIDADTRQVEERIGELKRECDSAGVPFRDNDEAVAIAVPKRNIETWIHYLDGQNVTEIDIYPKLERERDCKGAVNNLVEQCNTTGLRANAPLALVMACDEYRNKIKPLS